MVGDGYTATFGWVVFDLTSSPCSKIELALLAFSLVASLHGRAHHAYEQAQAACITGSIPTSLPVLWQYV